VKENLSAPSVASMNDLPAVVPAGETARENERMWGIPTPTPTIPPPAAPAGELTPPQLPEGISLGDLKKGTS
jgi:hypothetical protein